MQKLTQRLDSLGHVLGDGGGVACACYAQEPCARAGIWGEPPTASSPIGHGSANQAAAEACTCAVGHSPHWGIANMLSVALASHSKASAATLADERGAGRNGSKGCTCTCGFRVRRPHLGSTTPAAAATSFSAAFAHAF